MLLKNIQPFVRHVRHFTISDNTPSAYKDVKTRDNRIFFVTNGQGEIRIEGENAPLEKGTLALIRSGKSYRITPNPKLSVIVINFDFTEDFSAIKQSFHPFSADFPGILENITFEDTELLSSHIVLPDHPDLYERIRSLTNDFPEKNEWRDAFLSSSVKALIIDIVRAASNTISRRTKSPLVENVIRYMKEHYSERVENETLAERFHFTSVYINRLFKAELGISLRQYLITLRIDTAQELLTSSEYSPYEVALSVGFEDYPHFSKTFKKLTGKTPREYQHVALIKI